MNPDDPWLNSRQVRAEVGNPSEMTIWRWQQDPKIRFPMPDIVLNGRNYWFTSAIRKWKAGRTSQKEAA
jgi:predicted DNA-binding transcriptional regulator AlpA